MLGVFNGSNGGREDAIYDVDLVGMNGHLAGEAVAGGCDAFLFKGNRIVEVHANGVDRLGSGCPRCKQAQCAGEFVWRGQGAVYIAAGFGAKGI